MISDTESVGSKCDHDLEAMAKVISETPTINYEDYDEEQLVKAEAYKEKGNDYFKGK